MVHSVDCDQMKETERYKDVLAFFFTGGGSIRRPIKCFTLSKLIVTRWKIQIDKKMVLLFFLQAEVQSGDQSSASLYRN